MDTRRRFMMGGAKSPYIQFADPEVKRICVENWGSDGELTYEQAAAVTSFGTVFKNNTNISSFEESKYFTGITSFTVNGNAGEFDVCTNLVSKVEFPSLLSCGRNTFRESGITEFIAPRLLSISDATPSYLNYWGAFRNCPNLEKVSLGAITHIGQCAFYSCSKLTEVKGLDNLLSVGEGAFYSSAVKELILPSLTTIDGSYACMRMLELTKVIAPNLEVIPSPSSTYYNYRGTFSYCPKLSYVELARITSIGDHAFWKDSSLETVIINNLIPPILGRGVFAETPSTLKIYVPDEAVDTYKTAEAWSSYASQIHPISELLN